VGLKGLDGLFRVLAELTIREHLEPGFDEFVLQHRDIGTPVTPAQEW
jgi:hypothetical protein